MKERDITQHWLRRGLEAHVLFPAFGLLMLLVVWSGALHFDKVATENAQLIAMEVSTEVAETYSAQVIGNLAQIDQALKIVRHAYALTNDPGVLAELGEKGLLPSTFLFTVRIADRSGNVIASTRANESGHFIGQQHLDAHRSNDMDSPFAGKVTPSLSSSEPELTFSRRLDPQGEQLTGLVSVAVHPSYFTSGYEHTKMGSTGIIGLLGSDRSFHVKRRGDQIFWDEPVPAPFFEAMQYASSTVLNDALDGLPRYTNLKPMHGFPLSVLVSLSEQELLSAYGQEKRTYLWEAAIASAWIVLIVALMSRLAWQLSRNRKRMREIQQTYHAASEASMDGFFVLRNVVNAQGQLTDFLVDEANSQAVAFSGMDKGTLLGSHLCELFPQCRSNGVFEALRRVAQTGAIMEQECRSPLPDAKEVWLHFQVVRVDNGVVAIARDITDRKRSELLNIEQARVLEKIATGEPVSAILNDIVRMVEVQLPGASGCIMLVDPDGRYLRHVASRKLPAEYIRGINRMAIAAGAASCGSAAYWKATVVVADILQDPLWEGHRDLAAKCGFRACWSTPLLSDQNEVIGTFALYFCGIHVPSKSEIELVNMAVRISGLAMERKRAEERIHHMAHHDALTGLPNRVLLEDRVKQAMLHARRYNHPITVAFIDLDNFKLVNDTMGHKVGDELLKTVAERMSQCMRSTDTVVRLGGDEFILILADQADNRNDINGVLQRLRSRVCQPILIGSHTLQVSYSMGLARYPGDAEDPDTLLMHADAAMYKAKEMGRNTHYFYTPELNSENQEKIAMQEALRQAMAQEQLFLVYQPKVDLASGDIFSVEALLRWSHPQYGPISPIRFIPLAEETGAISAIGDWVMRHACMQNKMWQDAGIPPITVSVNVSARQFKDGKLIHHVADVLRESGMKAQYLELEVTESVVMHDIPQAVETMQQLQAMGVQLSIDDFGTGYSSLSALKNFPITRLKIDRSFVQDIPRQEDDTFIVKTVISLAHQLHLKVLAEGVETNEQLDFLVENGCDEIQGYHFSDPVSALAIEKLLRTQARRNRYATATTV
jgi:diguanylate cyclase (GGDEF)-like protein